MFFERLEDRVAPAVNMLDAGGLRFVTSGLFTQDGGDYTAKGGTVAIGYTPTGTEGFLALIQADLTGQGQAVGSLVLDTGPTDPAFTLTDARLDVVVVGGSPSVPLPIWKAPAAAGFAFHIGQITGGSGQPLTQGQGQPIEVPEVNLDFTLTTLQLANPDGGSTADAQVKMQGAVSLDKLNIKVLDFKNAQLEVDQSNYVIAAASGITLTGISVTKDLPSDAKIGGFAVSGKAGFVYTHDHDDKKTLGIKGTVTLTSQAQDGGKVGFKSVSAGLNFSMGFAPVQIHQLGFTVGGDFQIFGLDVSTGSDPLSFAYDVDEDQFEVGGDLTVKFKGNSVDVDLTDGGLPGLIIQDGSVEKLVAKVSADFKLFGAQVEVHGLTFRYQAGKFVMYGDEDPALSLKIPTGGSTQSLAADLGSQSDPGLVIVDGAPTQLNMGLSGNFDVFGLKLALSDGHVDWQPADDSLLISGSAFVDFGVFQTMLSLGIDGKPGLSIINGSFKVDSVEFDLEDAVLGPVTLNNLKVTYEEDGNSFDLDVDVDLGLPGGWEVKGEFDFVAGKLDTISVDLSNPNGIVEIGDTGLLLTDIHAKVQNIENPANIIVSGGLAVVWGEKFSLLGQQVYLFRAEGDFTADANELILDVSAQLGAHSPDGTSNWKGLLGEGDGRIDLDWGDGVYSFHVEVDGLAAVFDLTGDFTFADGKDIRFLAEVDVVVPNFVPFIGGDRLGGFGFFFDHEFQKPVTTTLAAWIELHIIWDIEVGFEVVYDPDHPKGEFSLIGAGTIDGFKKSSQPPVDRTYTFTADLTSSGGSTLIPGNATAAVLHADWSRPAQGVSIVGAPKFRVQKTVGGGTPQVITEDQFEANGIRIIDDPRFTSATTKAIQIVGSKDDPYAPISPDGSIRYALLIDVVSQGGNPFPSWGKSGTNPDDLTVQATHHVPKPTFGRQGSPTPYAPAVPPTPPGTFAVTLQGSMDEAFLASGQAKVTLYRVRLDDPDLRPVIVAAALPTRTNGSGVNWQATIDVPVDGLYPLQYVLYAVVDDGFNVPVKSAVSAPFTPDFAVQGSVANQNESAQTGWSVFLDYNRDGVRQPSEPTTTTSNPGGFYAFTPTFDPSTGFAPVPVGTPFNVVLVVPGPQFFAPVEPVTVTFDGSDTKAVAFEVKEKSAVKGIVFVDQGNNGKLADGTPLQGATVYLDANGDGVRGTGEPTTLSGSDGTYAFRGLQAGTYTVGLDVNAEAPAASYVVPAGLVGKNTSAVVYGLDFNLNQAIDVTSLGVFPGGTSGAWSLKAILYDRLTQVAVTTLSFNSTDPGTPAGGSYFKTLARPVTLYAGFQGSIVVEGYGNGVSPGGYGQQPVTWTTDAGGGTIAFVGGGRFGQKAGAYPTSLDAGPPNAYAAGSFLFREPVRIQTIPAGGTDSATIDASGFDVQEGNNFGVQSFASIGGSVTSLPLTGNVLGTNASPIGGVPVQLYGQEGYVAGVVTSSPTGAYSFGGLRPGTYTPQPQVFAPYRQITPVDFDPTEDYLPSKVWKLPGGGTPAPGSVAIADYNADGVQDLAVLDAQYGDLQTMVWIYYNDPGGRGFVSPPVAVSAGANPQFLGQPVKIVAGNFTATGHPQLAVLFTGGQVTLLPNPGGTPQAGAPWFSFPGNPTSYAVDMVKGKFFRGGTLDDLATVIEPTTGASYTVYAAGSGHGVVATGPRPGLAQNLEAGDINGDGITDLFLGDAGVNNAGATPAVYYGNGSGGFTVTPIGIFPRGDRTVVGDINSDGLPDLAVFDSNGNLSYAIQSPSGGFAQVITTGIATGSQGYGAVLRDVNFDFRPDLVWVTSFPPNGSPPLLVFINTGTPNAWFNPSYAISLPIGATTLIYSLAVSDIIGPSLEPAGSGDIVVTGNPGGQSGPQFVQLTWRSGITTLPLTVTVRAGQSVNNADFVYVSVPQSLDPDFTLPPSPDPDVPLPPSLDLVLTMPADVGSGDWTVRVRDGRLEVHDRDLGLWDSRPLSEVRSLTIVGADGRPNRVTLDLTDGPLPLPGGFAYRGSATAGDTVGARLDGRANAVFIEGATVTIDGRLAASWSEVDSLFVEAGGGDDTLGVFGTPTVRGVVTLDGGPGDDTYALAARSAALHIRDGSGLDTLGFAGAAAGVVVDLRLGQGQLQQVGGGNTLAIDGAIESLVGTPFDDVLRGDSVVNSIWGLAGNDFIEGFGGNDLLDGGPGDDTLFGGRGDDILLGGPGRDRLIDGEGRNLLIGGEGRDVLAGSVRLRRRLRRRGDILIGGSTAHDGNERALRAILAEWSSRHPFRARFAALRAGRYANRRLNGDFFLNKHTLRRDNLANRLIRDSQADWVLRPRGVQEVIRRPFRPMFAPLSSTAASDANPADHRH